MYPFPIHYHGDKAECLHEVQAGNDTWFVPAETPIAFVYNRQNYAVMMATADDLAEFAVGFSLSEAIIKSLDEIKSLELIMSEKGVDMRFKISLQAYERLEITLRRRNRIGSASCGLCGLENADVLFKKLPHVSDKPIYLPDESIRKALNGFSAFQPLNQKTRSVHGAAWAGLDGSIHFAFEDVGRHNAMDKLLGAIALRTIDVNQGFVIVSSRCSYEIIEKAALGGIKAILSLSAPTSFALHKAQEVNMAIYCRSSNGAVNLSNSC